MNLYSQIDEVFLFELPKNWKKSFFKHDGSYIPVQLSVV